MKLMNGSMNLLRQGVQGMYDLTLEHNNAKDAF